VTIRCNKVAGFGIQGNGFQRKFSARQNTSSYSWDFGDGTTSTKANPTHTYSDTGTYQVTLIANGSNCADTQTKQVTIRCRADAGFTISSLDNERDFDAKARANSASSTYHWDFGDGSTDTGAYVRNTYSRKDTYDVQLVVKDGPGCADTNTRQVVIGNSNSINGQIALQQGPSNRIDSLVVELYHYDSCKGVYNQIRSKTTLYRKDSAYYGFDSLPPGKFHVKADPSRDSNLSGKYVATYHQKATNWSNADSIVMSGLGKYTYRNDITLQKATNTSGSGNITGYVGGSKANCTNKRRPEDGPLANVPVLLLNENREPVARTTTGEEGNYQFNDLALSTYYVRVDLPGYQAKAEEVTLSSDQPKAEAGFEVSNEQVTPQESTGLAKEATTKATVELYPVPSRSQVTVTISDAEAEQLALRITNMQGQLMAQQRLSASGQQQDIQLDVSDWQSGAYILQLRDQHGQVKEARKLMVR
jgi:PKD repeat protein